MSTIKVVCQATTKKRLTKELNALKKQGTVIFRGGTINFARQFGFWFDCLFCNVSVLCFGICLPFATAPNMNIQSIIEWYKVFPKHTTSWQLFSLLPIQLSFCFQLNKMQCEIN